MPEWIPGPCIGRCGRTYTSRDGAIKHWNKHHDGDPPYNSHQGERYRHALVQEWSRLSSALPTYQKGIDALRLAYRAGYHEAGFDFISTDLSTSFIHTPWWHHILADLSHRGNDNATMISSADSLPYEDGHPSEISASLFFSSQPDLPREVAVTLRAALEIRPTASNGIKSCKHIVPLSTREYGVPAHGTKPDLTMAVTPAGHITEVHQDGVWDASILTQILGEKVLFTWPPSPHNLKIAAQTHRGDTSWLLEAIDELEQGSMVHLTPGCKFHLPIGTFHAVLSLTPSVLAGYRVHHFTHFAHIPRLLTWDVDASLALHTDLLLLRDIVNEHTYLFSLWLNQRAIVVDDYELGLDNIKVIWERGPLKKLNDRLIELGRPAKRSRR